MRASLQVEGCLCWMSRVSARCITTFMFTADPTNTVAKASPENHRMEKRSTLVLDTNVVLDWLVFRDTSSQLLHSRVAAGSVRWLASDSMRSELAHVLARGIVDDWSPDREAVWGAWERHAVLLPDPTPNPTARLRCTDPDDQKFIDFALAHRARWLISRDRAVLKLRERAAVLGLLILTPETWARTV